MADICCRGGRHDTHEPAAEAKPIAIFFVSLPSRATTDKALQQGAAAARGVVGADGRDALEHGRVRVREEDVQRVRRQVGQVLARELLERAHERLRLAVGLDRVAVRLELVGAGARGERDLQEGEGEGEG